MFDFSTLEIILIVALIVFITIAIVKLCKESLVARYVVGILIYLTLAVSAVFSGLNLNKYYFAEGGIFGYLGKVLNTNETTVILEKSDVTIKIDNINLVKQTDETYVSEIILDESIKLDLTKEYSLYINGFEANLTEYSSGHFKGSFSQVFYLDKSLDEKVTNKIDFSMFLYEKKTEIYLNVDSDVNSALLWNSYFEKQGCVIQIKSLEHNTNKYFNVNIFNNENIVVETYKVKKGSNFVLPKTLKNDQYDYHNWLFEHWLVDGKKTTKINDIQSDISIFAVCKEIRMVSFYRNYMTDANNDLIAIIRHDYNKQLELIDEPIRPGYIFMGWSFDKENVIDLSDFCVSEEFELYAIWLPADFNVEFKLNGGSLDFNGETYDEDFSVFHNFVLDLDISNLNKDENELFNIICFEASNNLGQSYNLEDFNLSIEEIYNDIYQKNVVYNPDIINEENPVTKLIVELQWLIVDDVDEYEYRKQIISELGLTTIPTSEPYIEKPADYLISNSALIKEIFEFITGTEVTEEMTEYEVCDVVLSSISSDDNVIEYDESITYKKAVIKIAKNLNL